ASVSLAAVYPTPQQMTSRGAPVPLGSEVALVTGPGSDPSAVSALTSILRADGVATIDTVGSPDQAAGSETAIFVGGPDEDPAAAGALTALKVQDASGLPAEGYVLATGRDAGRPVIVLDGHDASGTYYAVQTLRQLIRPGLAPKTGDRATRGGRAATVPGVLVRDWPDMAVRGVIEGFYGPEYTDTERTELFDFMGENKMNDFVYSPKDDPYLRSQWQDPYPAAQLDAITQLVQRATADHVQFTYALSPGLSVCYSSASDESTLVTKLESMYAIGVRSFSIPFDDITEGSFNCAADTAKWGTGDAASAEAQAYLLNEVDADFVKTHSGVQPLQMVPTEYTGEGDSAYKTALRQDLNSDIVVGWTGDAVIPPTITTAQAQEADQVYGHQVLLWDNYPVNDYTSSHLLMGPYTGRESGLAADLYGITVNPMIESEPSKIAEFGAASYTWNDTNYNAQAAWHAAINAVAGPDPRARKALAALSDLAYGSDLNSAQAPVLTAGVQDFWTAWDRGDTAAAGKLDAYLKVIQDIPTALPAMHDPDFIGETQPWLDSAGDWGTAARAALRTLVDERLGDVPAAQAARATALKYEASAGTYTSPLGSDGTVTVSIDPGVIAAFIASALAENDR
ncbi:MAG TPA: beta-N-acetylglucosaminidase domain-containing protein, partial [Trebonia sp.]|nr:beta-N-acetylglucosaminidase domain-containing protein [Trebonia sp.]